MLIRFVKLALPLVFCLIGHCFVVIASENVWSFVPARSFGTFHIGQDYAEIESTLGFKPDKVREVKDAYLVRFDSQGIIIQYNNFTNKVQFMGACKSGYKNISYMTTEGITVGSPKALVEKSYSTPTKMIPISNRDFYPKSEQLALYVEKGIAFHYDSNDCVVVILVFDPRLYGN